MFKKTEPFGKRGSQFRRGQFVAVLLAATALQSPASAWEYHQFTDDPAYAGWNMNDIFVSPDGSSFLIQGYGDGGNRVLHLENGTLTDIGSLGDDTGYGSGRSISSNGSVIVGESYLFGGATYHAYRWTKAGGMVDLGTFTGAGRSDATAVSYDGNIVVGSSETGTGNTHAFRWTDVGGMQDLGTLGGVRSDAYDISPDGSTIVGSSLLGTGESRAFRWTATGGMENLGTLGGESYADLASYDGSVIAGASKPSAAGPWRAFRWTEVGGMVNLDTLVGSQRSQSGAISHDGSVIAGWWLTGAMHGGVFRWTETDGMKDIGTLGGLDSWFGDMTADGSIIVGTSRLGDASVQAYHWASATGMVTMSDYLAGEGINVTGWTLREASSISDDGNVIAGVGVDTEDNWGVWWARIKDPAPEEPSTPDPSTPDPKPGLISSGIINRSFASLSTLDMAANNMAASKLDLANAFSLGEGEATRTNSVWASGLYDSDPMVAGEVGVSHRFDNGVKIGGSIGAHRFYDSLDYNGSFRFSGPSVGAHIGATPASGFQWMASAAAASFSGDVTRGYLNGSTPDFSVGHTSGHALGFMAKAGWTFDNVAGTATKFTPYASLTTTSSHINGWTETGGSFPGTVDAINSHATSMRLGAEARHAFTPNVEGWASAAWAHRMDGGRLANISGTVTGITAASISGLSTNVDWAELGVGMAFNVGSNAKLSSSVNATIPSGQRATFQSRATISVAF